MKKYFKPLITETTLKLAKSNWFTFAVSKETTKNEARSLAKEFFNVDVLDVKSLVVKGKSKRSAKTRELSKPGNWKKMMIKVKEGQKIEFFEV